MRASAASADEIDAAPKPPPLWRNRDFVLLWTGQAISTIGTRVSGLAFPLLVLAKTHSPAKAGIVGFAQTLPFMLFYLLAGALVDRWDRKRVMIIADGVRAVALGSIAFALAADALTLAQIIAVGFVEGAGFVFYSVSERAALPQVVPKEQISTAVAQNQARDQGADLLGQPLGGVLFGVSRLLPFAFDAISYAASFISLFFIRSRFQEERDRATTRIRSDIAEGVTWLWGQPFLRAGTALVAGSNFAFSAIFLALIVRAKQLGASSTVIGVMLMFFGAGAIAGALVAPWVQRRVHAKLTIMTSFWVWAGLAAVTPLLHDAYALGGMWAFGALFGPIFNVSFAVYRYALVPDRMLGRVGSVSQFVAWGAIPLGQLTAGLLLDQIGTRPTIFWLAGASAVVASLAMISPSIRHAPRVEELTAAAQ